MLEVLHVRLQSITEEQVSSIAIFCINIHFSLPPLISFVIFAMFWITKLYRLDSPFVAYFAVDDQLTLHLSIDDLFSLIFIIKSRWTNCHIVPVFRWEWQRDRRYLSWLLSIYRLLSIHWLTNHFLMTGIYTKLINIQTTLLSMVSKCFK